jgi:hypothetical protein
MQRQQQHILLFSIFQFFFLYRPAAAADSSISIISTIITMYFPHSIFFKTFLGRKDGWHEESRKNCHILPIYYLFIMNYVAADFDPTQLCINNREFIICG